MTSSDLIHELRASRPAAPTALRARIREISSPQVAPSPRSRLRFPVRRAALIAIPAAAVLAFASAGVFGITRSDVSTDAYREEALADKALPESEAAPSNGLSMYLSEGERNDFRQSENIFIEKGVAPLYETGAIDLVHLNEQNRASHLWLNVIGSEWFASIPDTLQPEIRERLRDLAGWGNVLLNYHPRRHALRYLSLNEELDFYYGFTKHYLITPQDTDQTLKKVDGIFTEIIMQGTNS